MMCWLWVLQVNTQGDTAGLYGTYNQFLKDFHADLHCDWLTFLAAACGWALRAVLIAFLWCIMRQNIISSCLLTIHIFSLSGLLFIQSFICLYPRFWIIFLVDKDLGGSPSSHKFKGVIPSSSGIHCFWWKVIHYLYTCSETLEIYVSASKFPLCLYLSVVWLHYSQVCFSLL